MYNSRKKPPEEILEEMTAIWSCSNEDCNGWMRDNFTLSIAPTCPRCQSEMVKGERMLETIVNTSSNQQKQ